MSNELTRLEPGQMTQGAAHAKPDTSWIRPIIEEEIIPIRNMMMAQAKESNALRAELERLRTENEQLREKALNLVDAAKEAQRIAESALNQRDQAWSERRLDAEAVRWYLADRESHEKIKAYAEKGNQAALALVSILECSGFHATSLPGIVPTPTREELLFLQNAKDACEIAELREWVEWVEQCHRDSENELGGHRERWVGLMGWAGYGALQERWPPGTHIADAVLAALKRYEAELAAIYATRCTITDIPVELLPEPGQVHSYLLLNGWLCMVGADGEAYWVSWVKDGETVAIPGRFAGRESQLLEGLLKLSKIEDRNSYAVLSDMRKQEVNDADSSD